MGLLASLRPCLKRNEVWVAAAALVPALLVAGSYFYSYYTTLLLVGGARGWEGMIRENLLDAQYFRPIAFAYSAVMVHLFGLNYTANLVVQALVLVVYGLAVRRVLLRHGAEPGAALGAALLSVTSPVAVFSTWMGADTEILGSAFLLLMLSLLPGLPERPSLRLGAAAGLAVLSMLAKETYRGAVPLFLAGYLLFLRGEMKPGRSRWVLVLLGFSLAVFAVVPRPPVRPEFHLESLALGVLHISMQVFYLVGAGGTLLLVCSRVFPRRLLGPLALGVLGALGGLAPISDFSYLRLVIFSDGSLPGLVVLCGALAAALLWTFVRGRGWERYCAAVVLGMAAATLAPTLGLMGYRTDISSRNFLVVAPLLFYLVVQGARRLWGGEESAPGPGKGVSGVFRRTRLNRIAVVLGVALVAWTVVSTLAVDTLDYRARAPATQLTKERLASLDLQESAVLFTDYFHPVFAEEIEYLARRPAGARFVFVSAYTDPGALVRKEEDLCSWAHVYLYHVSSRAAPGSPPRDSDVLWGTHQWVFPLFPWLGTALYPPPGAIPTFLRMQVETPSLVRWAVEGGQGVSQVRYPSGDIPRWPGHAVARLAGGQPVWLAMDVEGLLVDVTGPVRQACRVSQRF